MKLLSQKTVDIAHEKARMERLKELELLDTLIKEKKEELSKLNALLESQNHA